MAIYGIPRISFGLSEPLIETRTRSVGRVLSIRVTVWFVAVLGTIAICTTPPVYRQIAHTHLNIIIRL